MNWLFWSGITIAAMGSVMLFFTGRAWYLGAALYAVGMAAAGTATAFEYADIESFVFATACFALALTKVVIAGLKARKERKEEADGQ